MSHDLYDNLKQDFVQYFIKETLADPLVEHIKSMKTDAELIEAGYRDGDTVIASVELLAILSEQAKYTPPEPDEVEDWRDIYLTQWDASAPAFYEEHHDPNQPDAMQRRRAVIVSPFERLLRLSQTHHDRQ